MFELIFTLACLTMVPAREVTCYTVVDEAGPYSTLAECHAGGREVAGVMRDVRDSHGLTTIVSIEVRWRCDPITDEEDS